MLSAIKKFREQWQLRRSLRAFWFEMEKNLELFYVIDQRQFIINGFTLDAWVNAKDLDVVKRHESIRHYVVALEEINRMFKDYKDYEAWYTSDIKNKNPDNARKLHGLKHDLDKKVKTLEPVIITAGQDLEKEMVGLGLLKV